MLGATPHLDEDRPVRLHVLLTEDRPHAPEHWTGQFPRLLQPFGVVAHLARSAREAMDLVSAQPIHAAVIDLATPLGGVNTTNAEGGRWFIELVRRMPRRLPIVIINSPAFTDRQVNRLLQDALELGAFSVMNRPVEIEHLLDVFRRLLDRQYRGAWPTGSDQTLQ